MIRHYRLLLRLVAGIACVSAALGSYHAFAPAPIVAPGGAALKVPEPAGEATETQTRARASRAEVARLKGELAEREKQTSQLTEAKQAAADKLRQAEQRQMAAIQDPELQKKQQDVSKFRQAAPDWPALGVKNLDPLRKAWSESGNTPQVTGALAVMNQELERLNSLALGHQKAAADLVKQRLAVLVAFNKKAGEIEASLVTSLDVRGLKADRDKLLPAIAAIMTQLLRAKPGQNFLNSVGIDLVWVAVEGYAGGGFWIGKQETTKSAFEQVLPQEIANCSTDANGLIYRVLWSEADKFCDELSTKEAGATTADLGQLAPRGWRYQLPASGIWKYASQNAELLGLQNFDGGVSEFLSDTTASGFHTVFGTSPGAESSRYRNPLGIPNNREMVTVGSATDGAKAGRITHHEGRVGFRVILVQGQ